MGFFAQVTDVLQLDDQHSVVMRKLTAGERRQLESKYIHSYRAGGQIRMDVDTAMMELEFVQLCTVSWSGPNFEGRQATPENVAMLPDDVFEQMRLFADQLNAPLSEDEKKA